MSKGKNPNSKNSEWTLFLNLLDETVPNFSQNASNTIYKKARAKLRRIAKQITMNQSGNSKNNRLSVRNRRASILCFLHRDSKAQSTDCIASYNYRCMILLTSGGYDAHFPGTAGEVRSLVLSNNLQKIWRWHNIIQIHDFILQQIHLQAKCKVPFH